MGSPTLGQITTETNKEPLYWQLIDLKTREPLYEYKACLYLIFSDYTRHDAEISAQRYLHTHGGFTYEESKKWQDQYELILVKVEELKEQKEPVTE